MYKNFSGETWQDFGREAKNKDVYLFGWNTARYILIAMMKYSCPWKIKGILDNDKEKQGEKELPYTDIKIEVFSPEILKKMDNKEEIIVLICGTYISDMAEQLENMGITNYFSEYWMSMRKGIRHHNHQIEKNILEKLVSIMSDDESKHIIGKIVEKRNAGFVDYSDVYCRARSEYFRDEFWVPEIQGIFIDAGGFDGDTIEEYHSWTRGDYKHIYSFEPQKNMADKIEEKLWMYGSKVTLIKKGLWSQSGTIKFTNGDGVFSGKINANGEDEIETVALDDIITENVTFIKMDIEGAEVEAIKGAKQIICKYKPNMAICIYHKPTDLWEIPFLIHQLVPEYKLSVRHFGVSCSDTVLFARI